MNFFYLKLPEIQMTTFIYFYVYSLFLEFKILVLYNVFVCKVFYTITVYRYIYIYRGTLFFISTQFTVTFICFTSHPKYIDTSVLCFDH